MLGKLKVGLTMVTAAALISGCSIKQTVDPARISPAVAPEICMIPAAGVRQSLSDAYGSALQAKGFRLRNLPTGTSPSRCPLSTTYTGTWKWDLALYMRHAEFVVYEDGRRIGTALYDARSGSGRLDKFIDAEAKVNELVGQLFPSGASGLGQRPAAQAQHPRDIGSAAKAQQVEALKASGVGYEEYQRRYREIMGQ